MKSTCGSSEITLLFTDALIQSRIKDVQNVQNAHVYTTKSAISLSHPHYTTQSSPRQPGDEIMTSLIVIIKR